jgi:hypothetical protein
MKKILNRLATEGHDPGDVLGVGVHMEAKIDHFLLAAGEAGESPAHLADEIGEVFLADDAGVGRWGVVEEVFELGFHLAAGAAHCPGKVMTEGFEEIVFDKGGFADREPVDPKGEEEVVDTVFEELGVFCEPGAVVEEVLVVGMHQFAKGIGVTGAEVIPEKEVFVQ